MNLIMTCLYEERQHQDGPVTEQFQLTEANQISEELTIIRCYLHEVDPQWTHQSGDLRALDTLRRIVAVAIRCMQNHGAPAREIPEEAKIQVVPNLVGPDKFHTETGI
jgi:hypothetical protein